VCEMVPKCIQSHGLERYFEKRQCQNQPRLEHHLFKHAKYLVKTTFVSSKSLHHPTKPIALRSG
jgi:hypothetical protein